MLDTGHTGDQDLDGARAVIGRSASGAPRSALDHPYRAFGYEYRGMGGVVTTAQDLWKWDRALAKDSVLSDKAKQRLFATDKQNYACGWYVMRGLGGALRQSHGGSVRGFVCDMRRFPGADACIVVLLNSDDLRAWELADDLESVLFNKQSPCKVPESVALPPAELEACAGIYERKSGRLVLRSDFGALVCGIEGQALLDELDLTQAAAWKADPAALAASAVEILKAITQGDVEPLRARMAKRIPADWPEYVRTKYYPEHAERFGACRGVRNQGAVWRDGRIEFTLALEHETRESHVQIGFSSAGLERLEWNPAPYPAELRLLPQGKLRFDVMGKGIKQREVQFLRQDGRISSLKAGELVFRRGD
jgi:hypothetical protein